MDPVTIVVGVAVAVGVVVVLALITKFGYGGESDYEQTIAIHKEVLLDESKAKNHDKKKLKTDKKKRANAGASKFHLHHSPPHSVAIGLLK